MSKKLTTEEFIDKAKKIHGNKYDYSKVEYINNHTKVCIICPKHGEFWQLPNNHLVGKGCDKCARENNRLNKEEFIKKAKEIHGDKYDYSKVNYINERTKVCIICPEHGEFWQTPSSHLANKGCIKCGKISIYNKLVMSKDRFIEISNLIHNKFYSYDKSYYKNNYSKVIITCPIHGDFQMIPSSHMRGQGCPKCKQSHLERDITKLLDKNNIEYHYQYKFDFINDKTVDFYIPSINTVIECQGEQHYRPVGFGAKITDNELKEIFVRQQQRDYILFQQLSEKDISIVYYVNHNKFESKDINIYGGFYSDKLIYEDINELYNYIVEKNK